jgi:hypothetical protein
LGDTGFSLERVRDVSTGSNISGWHRPLWQRVGKYLGGGLIGGVLSAVGTLIVSTVAGGGQQQAGIDDPGSSTEAVVAWLLTALSGVVLLVSLAMWAIKRRNPLTPFRWAAEVGALVGCLVVAVSLSA